MKASKILTGVTLATLLSSAAQGAAIKAQAEPAAASWDEGAALLFPLPVLPNPWETAAQGAQGAPDKQADYPFAHGAPVVHGMNAKAEMAPMADVAVTISEPASEVLMLIGLSALAIAIRRKMPA